VLGGDQVVLIEPAGELGTPGQTTFVVHIMLRTCLTICHLTNFIIIHGITEERSSSIPGPSHIQQQGVWLRSTYLTNVANPASEYDSCYHGRTHLHLLKMFSIPKLMLGRCLPAGSLDKRRTSSQQMDPPPLTGWTRWQESKPPVNKSGPKRPGGINSSPSGSGCR
jgi:hypothetical protein